MIKSHDSHMHQISAYTAIKYSYSERYQGSIWQPKVHKLTGYTYRIMYDLVIARHLYMNTTSLAFKAISIVLAFCALVV